MAPVRVRVVADRMLADLLVHRFQAEPDLLVVGTAPQVVVLDAASCTAGWGSVVDELADESPEASLVMIAEDDDVDSAVDAARVGVAAWMLPGSSVEELVTVVRGVAQGAAWYPPRHLGAILRELRAEEARTSRGERLPELTHREREVLRLLVEGLSTKDIARRVDVSVNTVRTHTHRVYRKLGVHHRLEAVRVARNEGLVPDDG